MFKYVKKSVKQPQQIGTNFLNYNQIIIIRD